MAQRNRRLYILLTAAIFLTGLGLLAQSAKEEKLKEARRLLFDQKFGAALTEFEAVLGVDPDNLEAQLGKMDALGGLRKLDQITQYAKTKSGETTAGGMVIAANNQFWNRDLAGAEKNLRQAVQKDASNYMAQYMLGYLLNRTRRSADAIPFLEKAIQANPEFPESYYVLGDIYFSQNKSEKVIQYWREYLKRIPRSGSRYDYVNGTLQKLGGN